MNILAIETSCDETAAAIIRDGTKILSSIVVSQIDLFAAYGGVIPEIAARSHLEAILPVIDQAFEKANFTLPQPNNSRSSSNPSSIKPLPDWSKIDAIAVTHTPGLLGSLLIGTLTARTLAILHNKPLYPIHHLKSHIYSTFLSTSKTSPAPTFPILALLISGGHTQLIRMTSHTNFSIIGTTKDDAVGECFDKIAKILGLPYPGGPAIGQIATTGNRHKYSFPHPKVEHLDFSFSGLKTAVLRTVQKELNLPISHPSSDLKNHLTPTQIADFAASFEQTAIDILLEKTAAALNFYPDTNSIVIAGGVSANQFLRHQAPRLFSLIESSKNPNTPHSTSKIPLFFPHPSLSGDNAAMVGSAAYFEIIHDKSPADPYALNIAPRSPIK